MLSRRPASMQHLLGLLFLVLFTTCAAAQTGKGGTAMIEDDILQLSQLTGDDYLVARDAFLANAQPLPRYSLPLSANDPRFKTQYLILKGWQDNTALYRAMESELDAVNADFIGRTAAGFNQIYNRFARRTQSDWKAKALPFAWEVMLKFQNTQASWRITNAVFMLQAFPHEDSVDALAIAIHSKSRGSMNAFLRETLEKMPQDALEDRIAETGPFYDHVRPALKEALGNR